MDFDDIPLGIDFRVYLQRALEECDVLLVVIGPDWLGLQEGKEDCRLWQQDDYVRIEVEIALRRQIPVIPVLVGHTRMPSRDELPPEIRDLIHRQAASVNMDRDFHVHMERLIKGIKDARSRFQPIWSKLRLLVKRGQERLTTLLGMQITSLGFLPQAVSLTKRALVSVKVILSTTEAPSILLPILAWALIGSVTPLLTLRLDSFLHLVQWSPFGWGWLTFEQETLSGGILFGFALYLFGEYSRRPRLIHRNRIVCCVTLIVASVLGYQVAIEVAKFFARFPGLLFTAGDRPFTEASPFLFIPSLSYFYFPVAGALGSAVFVLAEMWCWRLGTGKWKFAGIVLSSAVIAGEMMSLFGGPWDSRCIAAWRGLVLAATCAALQVLPRRDCTPPEETPESSSPGDTSKNEDANT
jgi:hypothetical protein